MSTNSALFVSMNVGNRQDALMDPYLQVNGPGSWKLASGRACGPLQSSPRRPPDLLPSLRNLRQRRYSKRHYRRCCNRNYNQPPPRVRPFRYRCRPTCDNRCRYELRSRASRRRCRGWASNLATAIMLMPFRRVSAQSLI